MTRRLALVSMLPLIACAGRDVANDPAPAAAAPPASVAAANVTPAAPAEPPKPAGLDLAGMDRSVPPGEDFFAYANGTWLKTTDIPPDRGSWGASGVVSELTAKRVVELIEAAAKSDAPAGSDARKVGDYYATYMDEAAIEAKGLSPVQPKLDAIAAIKDRKALAKFIGSTLRTDIDLLNSTSYYTPNLFGLWIAQDLDDPSRYSPFLVQGGLGMPDREYYVSESPRMAELRTKYQAHIERYLALAGIADAKAKAERIFDLEKRIAQTHATRNDTDDVQKGNNHWSRADLKKRAPGLDWEALLVAAGLAKQQDFVVWQPGAVTGTAKLAGEVPLSTWKEYLTFRALNLHGGYLPKAFVDERFEFFGKAMAGTKQQRDRWKRAVSATNEALGEVVGKLYVEKYFPASEKARAEKMVQNVIAAFGRRIDRLDWMAPETKERAKAKLAVMKVGVGYPDKWRDYSGYEVVRGDAYGNAERASLYDTKQKLARLGQPVDRTEWVMDPHLVNAVNLPAMNAMNFPAGMLQPPYFDPNRPEAMDYGAIGAVIGHEICHSFDSSGALFDSEGRLKNWWKPEDFAKFKESTQKLVAQYDAYKPFPDLALRGEQTLAENIADVAGLSATYDAWKDSLGGKDAPVVAGLTGDQQFFISFAQSWRSKAREPSLRAAIIGGGHSPGQYRAYTVRNLDAWYAAFEVKPGQALYLSPGDRVRIW